MEKFISKYNKFEKKILKRIKLRKVFNINTVYGRRHLKLFTNCHVSWDTLYLKKPHKIQWSKTLANNPKEEC